MEVDIGRHEVLPGERFSHMTEPMVSFSRRSVWINMGCLTRMPDTIYVHFLLFRPEKSMIIKPCAEDERDAVRWRTLSGRPRNILCDEDFWIDITTLMGWNDNNRYRLLGRFIHDSGWDGFAFDMTRAEGFPLPGTERNPESQPCKEVVWRQTWEEHCRNPLVSRFAEDTLIVIDEEQ